MRKLSIKFVFLSLISVFLISGTIFVLMPTQLRSKVQNKTVKVWENFYTRNLKQEIDARRTVMQKFYNSGDKSGSNALIAHGGGIGRFTYTNCQEGVLDALARGFTFIELDLQKTKDDKIVALHDWHDFAQLTGKQVDEVQRMSLHELKQLKIQGKYTVLGGEDIKRLMQQYPQFVLVTDKLQDFGLILREIPYPERMIVETFGKYNYLKALRAGIIYPAYSTWSDTREIEKYQFPIVVMAAHAMNDEANADKVKLLHENKITILMHWAEICDKPDFINQHLGSSISKIYTDAWAPAHQK